MRRPDPEHPAPADSARASATLAETVQVAPGPAETGAEAHATSPGADERTPPSRVGRYAILRRLGEGGMGTVWSAYDERLDRRVAIKVLVADGRSDQSRERMLREAKALARINHPNVVQVFEVGELGDDVYLAMEFVRGASLADWLETPRDFATLLGAFIQAGRGLEAVHDARLVHRDFKPHNAVMGDDGRVRLIDFGIARLNVQDDADGPEAAPLELEAVEVSLDRLTRTGQFVGTPAYMSPEQLRGLPVDARSDQFSFCVAMFRAVYGVAPFAGDKAGELALNVFGGAIVDPPKLAGVPPRLLATLRRGLDVDPALRFPDIGALLGELEELRRRRTGRTARTLVGAAAVAVVALAALGLRSDRECTGADEALAAVWSEARADRIAREFATAGAEPTWTRARLALDGWGERWIAQHTDACEAHRRGEQSAELLDRRMACIEGRKRDLDALLGEFEQFDPALVTEVVGAAGELPAPADCGDAERLASDGPTTPSAAVAARVTELEAVLAKAQAQERAGRVVPGRRTLEPIVAEVDALAWPPLALGVHETLARISQEEGRLDDAQREYEAVFRFAVAHRADAYAVRGALGLAIVIGVQQGRFADAEAWLTVADAWITRTGDDVLDRVSWQQTMAGIRERQGRPDEAQRVLEDAIAKLGTLPRSEALALLASTHNALGFVYRAQRRFDDAEQAYLRTREFWLELLGPDHPLATDPLNNLGTLYLDTRRHAEAKGMFEDVLAERMRLFGPDHVKVAHVLHNLGTAATKRGDSAAALGHQRAALDILERTLGPDDPAVATSLVALGETHLALEDPVAALPYIRRALAIDEARLGPDHPEVAWDLNSLAMVHNAMAQWDEARRAAERALVIREEHAPPDRIGQTRLERARALAGLGRLGEARRDAQQAVVEFAVEPDTQREIEAWIATLDAPTPGPPPAHPGQ